MSSNEEIKAAAVSAPFGNGTDDTNLLLVESGTTHAACALPASWSGQFVTVEVLTASANVWFFVSKNLNAEVDQSIANAADGNPGPKLGKKISTGKAVRFMLPEVAAPDVLYLIHESDTADASLEIQRSSG
jgi:hypothetical protein